MALLDVKYYEPEPSAVLFSSDAIKTQISEQATSRYASEYMLASKTAWVTIDCGFFLCSQLGFSCETEPPQCMLPSVSRRKQILNIGLS